MIGQKFGKLVVVEEMEQGRRGTKKWLCQCECGNQLAANESALQNGRIKSCGCDYRGKDLIGQKFGMLTVVGRAINDPSGGTSWLTKCDCGNQKIVRQDRLTPDERYLIHNCGCLTKEVTHRHGLTDSPLYSVWCGMKTRCYNPNFEKYKYYGGRGIKICDRWHDFRNFYEDMASSYKPGLQLDRIDNDGDYSPENCRWVTRTENMRHTSHTHVVKTASGDMSLSTLEEFTGTNAGTMRTRLKQGCPELIVSTREKIDSDVKDKIVQLFDINADSPDAEGIWLTDEQDNKINKIVSDVERQIIEDIPHG